MGAKKQHYSDDDLRTIVCPGCARRWVNVELDAENAPQVLRDAALDDDAVVQDQERRRKLEHMKRRKEELDHERDTGMDPRVARIVSLFSRTACPWCSKADALYKVEAKRLIDFGSAYINIDGPLAEVPGYPTPTHERLIAEVEASDYLVRKKGLRTTGFLRQLYGDWKGAQVFTARRVPRPAVPSSRVPHDLMVAFDRSMLRVVFAFLCSGPDCDGVVGYCYDRALYTLEMAAFADYSASQFSTNINDQPTPSWAALADSRIDLGIGSGDESRYMYPAHAAARFVLGDEMCDRHEKYVKSLI